MAIRVGELYNFTFYILTINVYTLEARGWRNENGVMLVKSKAHFIWQTLLASLVFWRFSAAVFLLSFTIYTAYDAFERETICCLLINFNCSLCAASLWFRSSVRAEHLCDFQLKNLHLPSPSYSVTLMFRVISVEW